MNLKNRRRWPYLCFTFSYTSLLMSLVYVSGCGVGTPVDRPESRTPPVIAEVVSSVGSRNTNAYTTGSMVRIDIVEGSEENDIVAGTIRITSASTGYDSGIQKLSFGSIFYHWNTSGLAPASDYIVDVTLTDSEGQTTTSSDALSLVLRPNPPLINKLVSDEDLSVPSRGLPVQVVRMTLPPETRPG